VESTGLVFIEAVADDAFSELTAGGSPQKVARSSRVDLDRLLVLAGETNDLSQSNFGFMIVFIAVLSPIPLVCV